MGIDKSSGIGISESQNLSLRETQQQRALDLEAESGTEKVDYDFVMLHLIAVLADMFDRESKLPPRWHGQQST